MPSLSNDQSQAPAVPARLKDLWKASLKIGLLSFGGPAAQIALMHKEFVEDRKWVAEDRFLHALSFCMLLPGPEAQQLATYCGWIVGRTLGGLIAGLLFILPGAIAMAAVSYVYLRFGDVAVIDSLFYGIKAGVLAIVLQALIKVARKALKTRLSWLIALGTFIALFMFSVPFPVVIAGAGLCGLLGSRSASDTASTPPADKGALAYSLKTILAGAALWLLPPLAALALLGPDTVLLEIAEFFSVLAVVSFGGAYALLSYMAQIAVEARNWMSAGEMADGLGLAETTPGPLILVTQFVGFVTGWRAPEPFSPLAGALLAAAMTTWMTFVPSFVFVLAGAPWIERLRGNARLGAVLSAITAAVTGTILNLAIWFALNVFFAEQTTVSGAGVSLDLPNLHSADIAAMGIAAIAAALLFAFKQGVPTVVGVTAALGLAVRLLS